MTDEDVASALLRLYLRVHGRLLLGLLLGLLLRVLFGKMAANQTTAHCANHGVMSGVMTGDPADDRALDATGRIGRSDGGERQRGAQEGKPGATCFHVSITRVWMGAKDVLARITPERQMMDDGSQYKRQDLRSLKQQYEIGNAALLQSGWKAERNPQGNASKFRLAHLNALVARG